MSYYGSEIDQEITRIVDYWRREAWLRMWVGYGIGFVFGFLAGWWAL